MKITSLTEAIFGESPTIDTDAGVIRGVKALGRVSRNGREYSDSALAECARMYEGAQINLNHPGKKDASADRPFQEGIGWMKNVQIRADGVYGDLHYLKSHPNAPMLVESAERNPTRFGLSHNAEGSLVKRGGKNVVESVNRVHSIDIVQNPATNRGLFESEEPAPEERKPVKTRTLKALIETIDPKHESRPVFAQLLEMDGINPDVPLPDYSEPDADDMGGASDGDADDMARSAFQAMVIAVLGDDSMDLKAKVSRIKEILQAQEKLLNPDSGESAAETESEPETEGSDGMTTEAIQKQRLEHATELLEAAGITASPAQVKALAAMEGTDERKALIESWKPTPVQESTAIKAKKPAAVRLAESLARPDASTAETIKYPEDTKSFMRQLKTKV